MTDGDDLDDGDHIIRSIGASQLVKDEHGVPTGGILPDALRRRLKDGELEAGLSVTWQEYFAGPPDDQIVAAVKAMRAARSLGKNSGFAIGNVGAVKARCSAAQASVRVVYAPVDGNKAHAEVIDLPVDDHLLEQLVTNEWSRLVLNRDIAAGAMTAPDQPAQR